MMVEHEEAHVGEDIPSGWAVHAWGSPDMPPIVLLHGFMQDGDFWKETAESLARDYYVVAPTMTVDNEGDASLDRLAAVAYGAAQQAMLHTGWRTVVMLGYSMGGRIALSYARQFPATLSALILESTGLGPETEDEREAKRAVNEKLVERLRSDESMESIVDYWESLPIFESQKTMDVQRQKAQRKHRLACDKTQLAWALERGGAQMMPPAAQTRELLQGLDIPMLYIAGRHDEAYCKIAAGLEGSNVTVSYIDSGHDTHLEAPIEFAHCVTGFLEGKGIGGSGR